MCVYIIWSSSFLHPNILVRAAQIAHLYEKKMSKISTRATKMQMGEELPLLKKLNMPLTNPPYMSQNLPRERII